MTAFRKNHGGNTMYEFIPSKSARIFCDENGIAFSDSDCAAIVIRDSQATIEEKIKKLDCLAAKTRDEELKREIEEFSSDKKQALAKFCDNGAGDFIFTVIPEFENIASVHTAYEDALEVAGGLCSRKTIQITKQKIKPLFEKILGEVWLDNSGNILGIVSAEIEWNEGRRRLVKRKIPFIDMFDAGDIVRRCGSNKFGVVESEYVHRGDCDGNICVAFIEKSDVQTERVSPVFLEKVLIVSGGLPEEFNKIQMEDQGLIVNLSRFIKVTDSIDGFLRWYKVMRLNLHREHFDGEIYRLLH